MILALVNAALVFVILGMQFRSRRSLRDVVRVLTQQNIMLADRLRQLESQVAQLGSLTRIHMEQRDRDLEIIRERAVREEIAIMSAQAYTPEDDMVVATIERPPQEPEVERPTSFERITKEDGPGAV